MKNKAKKIGVAAVIPAAMLLATLSSSPPPARHVPLSPPAVGASRTGEGGEESPATPCPTTLSACPPEGCRGDPALNQLKNRLDIPTDGDVEPWSLTAVISLNEDSPVGWSRKNSREPLKELGEGTPVSLRGWLINAKPSALETCNCKVKGVENKDFHLNLVSRQDDPLKESVVVEMSPRTRHEGWKLTTLQAAVDEQRYVRVTGWLMFDSMHANFESAGMPRATAWEVHPVTKFEVCTKTKKDCDKGTGWELLEELQ
jgi:hypothetical protein